MSVITVMSGNELTPDWGGGVVRNRSCSTTVPRASATCTFEDIYILAPGLRHSTAIGTDANAHRRYTPGTPWEPVYRLRLPLRLKPKKNNPNGNQTRYRWTRG